MTRHVKIRRLFFLMSAAGMISYTMGAMASGFQLWETDGVSIGDYHAGHAAVADDASTSFNNPAGLVRIHNQQILLGVANILTNFQYRGTVAVKAWGNDPMSVTVQGGGYNFVPFGHYAAPITDRVVFGLSVLIPFGLETDYGSNTVLRYAAMLSSLKVVDYAPSLGIGITQKLSIGVGLDYETMECDFNETAAGLDETEDTLSKNSGSGNAWGYHLGVLYQFTPGTRIGLSYHSKVSPHLTGHSTFTGSAANNGNEGSQRSTALKTDIPLPAVTSLSAIAAINSEWNVMTSVSYVQWNVIKNIVLQNVAGAIVGVSTNTLLVTIPQNFNNTWNYSVGTSYQFNDKWILRSGIGYDQTPTNDRDRSVMLPDANRIIFAIGGHYQATKAIGFDLGWTHVFSTSASINNHQQVVAEEVTTTNGKVYADADVYALQLKWDIA